MYQNYFVPPYYDSMIGKVIAYGDTREQAIARMRVALSEMIVEGIKTNIPLHQELLLDDKFLRGGTSIHYLEERSPSGGRQATVVPRAGSTWRAAPRDATSALRFDADAATADAWADALLAAGALSVDAADPRAGTADETPLYGEPGEDPGALWPVSRLTALFAGDADPDAALAARGGRRRRGGAAARALHGRRRGLGARDAGAVRADRHRRRPVDRPVVVRTGRAGRLNLLLDPGLAFGTGSHPTTRLCLRWLAANLRRGASVLDYGCGSGILAIAAARLGAGIVTGTDVDPQAIAASRANAARNEVVATFGLPDEHGEALHAALRRRRGPLRRRRRQHPCQSAAAAGARAGARVRAGGTIVLSGVLAAQAGEVIASYAPWFSIGVWDRDEDWVALAGIRNPAPAG